MKWKRQNKLCVECGKVLKDDYEFVRNITTSDYEAVCTKCVRTIPKLTHTSIEELDRA